MRILGEKGIKVRNTAPLIYSGRQPMASSFPDADEKAGYDEMMMERFAVFAFKVPIPREERSPNHPHCGKCCASFYLEYGCASVPPPALLALRTSCFFSSRCAASEPLAPQSLRLRKRDFCAELPPVWCARPLVQVRLLTCTLNLIQ